MADAVQQSRWQRVYLLGDSLTQQSFSVGGWGGRLMEKYQRRFDVVNRGFSGYTSKYVAAILPRLAREDQLMLRRDIAAVVIWLGANDAVLDVDKRRVPVNQYIFNMRAISAELARVGCDLHRQVFVSPPPVAEAKWAAHCETQECTMNLSNDNTKKYADALGGLTQELKLPSFINLHESMQAEEDWEEMLNDGLHLSPKGNEFVAEKVASALENILPLIDECYPPCGEIDPENPKLEDA